MANNKKNIKAVIRSIEFNEIKLPLEAITGTNQVRLLDLEEVPDPATGELKAIKLTCGIGLTKSGMYLRSFTTKIEGCYKNKLTPEEVEAQPYIELENAYVVPYAFNTDRGVVRGATVVAEDFTVISEEDLEVVL